MKEISVKVRPVAILRANKAQKAHIHNAIIAECGGHDIPYVTGANVVLLFNSNLSVDEAIASIQGLQRFIELRARDT